MQQLSIVRGQFTYFEVRLRRPERLSDHVGRGSDKDDRYLHVAPTNKLFKVHCLPGVTLGVWREGAY